MYRWLPHESIDDRVKYMIYLQGAIVVFISIGVLVMVYQKTPCVNHCEGLVPAACSAGLPTTMYDRWLSLPASCFPVRNASQVPLVLLSTSRHCPT